MLFKSIKKVKDQDLQSYYRERYQELILLTESDEFHVAKEANQALEELTIDIRDELKTQD